MRWSFLVGTFGLVLHGSVDTPVYGDACPLVSAVV